MADTSSIDKDTVVIDVRTPGEFSEGHFAKSINIPLDQIESVVNKVDKSKKIIVCCRSGARSERAKEILEDLGYKNVKNAGSWTQVK